METLMIEDLPRNDELTVEEMKTIKGGFFALSATDHVFKAVGEALAAMARS